MTDRIVFAESATALHLKLLDAGVIVMAENAPQPAPGISISYIGETDTGYSALLMLDGEANEAEIVARLEGNLDARQAPLRVRAGSSGLAAVTAEAIKAERDRRTTHGGFKVGANWFHSDLFSRSQHLGMAMMGASLPSGIQWKTMGGSRVAMTPTLAGQIFAAAAASDMAIFAVAEAAIAAIAADPAAYRTVGEIAWPKMFGE